MIAGLRRRNSTASATSAIVASRAPGVRDVMWSSGLSAQKGLSPTIPGWTALIRIGGNDERLGLAIGNFANEMTALYVSDQPSSLQFSDLANLYGLGAPTQPPLKFGLFFFDYDLDGRPDLLSANGHLESDISQVQASQTYPQPAQQLPQAR